MDHVAFGIGARDLCTVCIVQVGVGKTTDRKEQDILIKLLGLGQVTVLLYDVTREQHFCILPYRY